MGVDIVGILSSIDMNDLNTLVFFFFGESILMFFVSLRFLGVGLTWKKLFISAFIYATFVLIVRKAYLFYEIPFGTHVLILGLIFALIIVISFRMRLIYGLVSSLLCFPLILAGFPVSLRVVEAAGLTADQIMSNYFLNTFIGYTEDIYLILTAIFLQLTKFNISKILK